MRYRYAQNPHFSNLSADLTRSLKDMLMEFTTRTIAARKHIALVSHDHCKKSLLEWVMENKDLLSRHELYATGTTGNLVQKATGIDVHCLLSGPMGGDQEVGALISEKKIDMLIFFLGSTQCSPA
ncbi:Methylglyoxal synthase [Yersinia aldovae ATCC 35236]|nr:Methylglyoxal synthase [Yersinia aldovae ATCC 35236]